MSFEIIERHNISDPNRDSDTSTFLGKAIVAHNAENPDLRPVLSAWLYRVHKCNYSTEFLDNGEMIKRFTFKTSEDMMLCLLKL